MTWSEGVAEQFEIVDLDTTEESDLYGAFNSLLFELFPTSEHYQVSPKFNRVGDSFDFTLQFIVRHRRVPVFFVEVKTLRSLKSFSARGDADDQMRQRFRELVSGTVATPTIYGISAFGPRFCVYGYNSASRSLYPTCIPRDPVIFNDTAPEGRWMHNFLEEAGEKNLRDIVNHVKSMASAL